MSFTKNVNNFFKASGCKSKYKTKGYKKVNLPIQVLKSSELSAVVQQYDEGKITLEELKSQYPDKYQDIINADKFFRTMYDMLIDNINKVRARIYPYVEQAVQTYENRLDEINEKLDLIEHGELEKLYSLKTNQKGSRIAELTTTKEKIKSNSAEPIKKIDADISILENCGRMELPVFE